MKGKELYEEFLEQLKSETISGKTMYEWRKYFTLIIPPDPTPTSLTAMFSKLGVLYQEAAFYKARADRASQSIKRTT